MPRWVDLNALLAAECTGWLDGLDEAQGAMKDTLRHLLNGYRQVESRHFLATLPRLRRAQRALSCTTRGGLHRRPVSLPRVR